MQIEETKDSIKRNWEFLTPEQIADLEARGVIRSIVHATNVQEVFGDVYEGGAAVRRVYVFGTSRKKEDIVGVHTDWVRIDNINPNNVAQTIGLGVSLEPRIIAALIETNGGNMPAILPPFIPEPEQPVEEPTEPETPEGDGSESN